MTLIYVLLVAHFVGDFLCQSDWMALNKSKGWNALGLHVSVYTLVLLAFAVGYVAVSDVEPVDRIRAYFGALAFVGWNAAAHFVQDAITSRINARLWFIDLNPMSGVFDEDGAFKASTYEAVVWPDKRHWFFVAIGADQLLHYVTLFVTAEWWLR